MGKSMVNPNIFPFCVVKSWWSPAVLVVDPLKPPPQGWSPTAKSPVFIKLEAWPMAETRMIFMRYQLWDHHIDVEGYDDGIESLTIVNHWDWIMKTNENERFFLSKTTNPWTMEIESVWKWGIPVYPQLAHHFKLEMMIAHRMFLGHEWDVDLD